MHTTVRVKSNQSKPNQTKPNQTKSNQSKSNQFQVDWNLDSLTINVGIGEESPELIEIGDSISRSSFSVLNFGSCDI